MDRWEASDAAVTRYSPWAFRGAFGVLLVGILSLALPLFNWLANGELVVPAAPLLASFAAIVVGAVASLFLASGASRRASARVVCDATGVTIEGARALDRADVAYGFAEPQPNGETLVKLFDATHGLRLAIRAKDAADAQALLQALALDVGQRVAPFFAASPVAGAKNALVAGGGFFATALLLLFAQSFFDHSVPMSEMRAYFFFGFPPLYFLVWSMLGSVATRVSVGADGVHTSWLGRRKFVPYREIERVVPELGQLRIVTKDKRSIVLRGQRRSFRASTRADHRAMVERLRAAIEEHVARDRTREALEHLPRARASAGEWLRELRALAVGAEGSYRRAVVSHDALWRVIEDPSVDAVACAGAAVALGSALDEQGRARLRVAAEASASPKLRVALEAASKPDDEGALEDALDALTTPEPAKKLRRA